jgi:hypothetical protein
MKPYLIFEDEATTRPVPEGWALKPVGPWDGRDAVVAYDPQRYDVQVSPHSPNDDTFAAQDLRHCGWEVHATGPVVWQTRINRRIVEEGTWHDCAGMAHEAVAYAHGNESISGSTTTAGVVALLTFGAQAREGEPAAAVAYGLSVSVRPKGSRSLWVRDRIEMARAALDRTAHIGPDIEVPRL